MFAFDLLETHYFFAPISSLASAPGQNPPLAKVVRERQFVNDFNFSASSIQPTVMKAELREENVAVLAIFIENPRLTDSPNTKISNFNSKFFPCGL